MSRADDDPEPRQRTLTEKGLTYELDVRGKERRHLINNLNNLSTSLRETLKYEPNPEAVKSRYTIWLSAYEQLLSVHEKVQGLLDLETAKHDHELFERQSVDFLTTKLAVEQWFMEQSQGRTGTKSDGKSVRGSVKTDVSSHVSIERVKEDQRKAELLARQEAVKQKRTIAEEKLRLKLKEEELEIQTEIMLVTLNHEFWLIWKKVF
ncbi:hypothetical protein DPMN_088054 [Dreissena polymorpha]|uniref:Uncharacterized protein n=1 Tax=Dreissena polymorpha TaxID=45954 RepID=A0A9D4KTU6_DREPO|nr:hypothetical protein DPMN_088054 [Dreissena polymorpha]